MRVRPLEKLSAWRQVALGVWGHPRDPVVLGIMTVDMSRAQPWLAAAREQSGEKLTPTHLVVAALARVLHEHPDLNVMIRRGALFQRETVDVFCQVAIPPREGERPTGTDLSGVKIDDTPAKGILGVARELRERAERIRGHGDADLDKSKKMMRRIPGMLLPTILGLATRLKYDFGINMPGTPRGDPFGSAMVTNVGVFGVDIGFAPLLPLSRTPMIILMGAVADKVVAIDGKVEIRPTLTMTGTFDHRVVDGAQCGLIAREMKRLVEDPASWITF